MEWISFILPEPSSSEFSNNYLSQVAATNENIMQFAGLSWSAYNKMVMIGYREYLFGTDSPVMMSLIKKHITDFSPIYVEPRLDGFTKVII